MARPTPKEKEKAKDEPAVVAGRGVPTGRVAPPPQPPAEEEAPAPEPVPISNYNPDEEYFDKPSVVDQLANLPESCLPSSAKCKIFKLGVNAQDEMAYDKFMLDTVPAGAPKIVVLKEDEQFHEGTWMVKLTYITIRYKKLVPTKEIKS